MRFLAQNCFRTISGTALSGLWLGFGLTLVYSALFALYALVRSSLQIALTLSLGEGLVGTLVANAFALLLPILSFALLLGIGAALLQSVTLLLVHGLAALINPHLTPIHMAGIGAAAAALLAGAIQVMVQQSLGSYFAALWPTGYLFWLGLPSLLFVTTTTWVSWRFAVQHPSRRTLLAPAAV
jgi:hypothetical protein